MKFRILAFITLVMTITGSLIVYISISSFNDEFKHHINILIKEVVKEYDHSITHIRSKYINILSNFVRIKNSTFSRLETDREAAINELVQTFKTLKSENPYISSIFYLNKDGKLNFRISDSVISMVNTDNIPVIQDLIKNEGDVSGFSVTLHGLNYRLFSPLYIDGELKGYVGAEIMTDEIIDSLTKMDNSLNIAILLKNKASKTAVLDKREKYKYGNYYSYNKMDSLNSLKNSEMEKNEFIQKFNGETYNIKLISFSNYKHEVIGKIFISHNITDGINRMVNVSIKIAVISLLATLISVFFLYVSLNKLFHKLINSERTQLENNKFTDMGRMINAVAHQWRQPLNVLGLYIQDIKETKNEGMLTDEYLDNFENDSMKLINKMSGIIDEFRMFFAPGKEKLDFDIVNATENVLDIYKAKFYSANIEYSIHYENTKSDGKSEKRLLYYGYETDFKQAVLNIVSNSYDAIEKNIINSVISKGYITIVIYNADDYIEIMVQDNGGGIPVESLDNIFDPYYSTKEEGKGTGVGLSITRSIIESKMNGKIKVENNKQGALFVITLPIVSHIND